MKDCSYCRYPNGAHSVCCQALIEGQETMRDRFAMAALTGLLASGVDEFTRVGDCTGKYIQDTAYRLADAMLSARKGPDEGGKE